eukprot:m.447844 g.447844  ORF g.447844 m.447844 type:complete len:104 (+) comp21504_c0_seq10:1156-1467(+)
MPLFRVGSMLSLPSSARFVMPCVLVTQVYPMEKITAEGNIWHKKCFRCTANGCGKMLSLGNFAAMGGQLYCKPCFKKMFKLKGNYDEGFGKEQHKKKWITGEK